MSAVELGAKLGEGSTAEVFEAHFEGARVACKRPRDAASAERVRREFALLRRVQHPRVVAARGLIETDAGPLLVLDRVDGDELVQAVRRDAQRPATPTRAHLPMAFGQHLQAPGTTAFLPCSARGLAQLASALAQAAEALEALHTAGFAHRDVRAPNLRLDARGALTVIDLGLGAELGAVPDDAWVPPVSHLPPEWTADAPATRESDLYALGVVLFEALTGDLPFAGTGQDVLLRKLTVSAPRPSLLVPGVPDALDALCARLLEPSPRLRARSEDVRRALAQSPDQRSV